jgi:hypothetical protein
MMTVTQEIGYFSDFARDFCKIAQNMLRTPKRCANNYFIVERDNRDNYVVSPV